MDISKVEDNLVPYCASKMQSTSFLVTPNLFYKLARQALEYFEPFKISEVFLQRFFVVFLMMLVSWQRLKL